MLNDKDWFVLSVPSRWSILWTSCLSVTGITQIERYTRTYTGSTNFTAQQVIPVVRGHSIKTKKTKRSSSTMLLARDHRSCCLDCWTTTISDKHLFDGTQAEFTLIKLTSFLTSQCIIESESKCPLSGPADWALSVCILIIFIAYSFTPYSHSQTGLRASPSHIKEFNSIRLDPGVNLWQVAVSSYTFTFPSRKVIWELNPVSMQSNRCFINLWILGWLRRAACVTS